MNKILTALTIVTVSATSAFSAEIKPYVGGGLVIDKAGTSAKRVGFNPANIKVDMSQIGDIPAMIGNAMGAAIVRDGGGDMKFDAAMAGEFVMGVKWGDWRLELQTAFRGASEDAYTIFNGEFAIPDMPAITVAADIATTTSVEHNSYLANVYYDFDLNNEHWVPYIGAGIGLGTYKQTATVDASGSALNGAIPFDQSMVVLENNERVFEWQIAVGTLYKFTENWGMDMAYRFNSATIGGEFVYAHELKVGARYTF